MRAALFSREVSLGRPQRSSPSLLFKIKGLTNRYLRNLTPEVQIASNVKVSLGRAASTGSVVERTKGLPRAPTRHFRVLGGLFFVGSLDLQA